MHNLRPILPLLALPLLYVTFAGKAESAAPLPEFDIDMPFTFAAGQPARASEVNANFGAIESAVEQRATEVDDQFALVDSDINSLITRSDLLEQDLAELANPANVIQVALSGAPFDSVAEALASITDASEDNRYLVQVAPGVYDETTTAIVPAFVTLRGSGPTSTMIRSAASNASASSIAAKTVSLENAASVMDLRIENTGATGSSVALGGNQLDKETLVRNVVARAVGNGGVGHFAMHVTESDLRVIDCTLLASGASLVNTGFGCSDSSGPFSQPLLQGCVVEAEGPTTGLGVSMTSTALQMNDCSVLGGYRGVMASTNGISTIRDTRIQTQNNNPVYEQTGSASILSGNVFFIGGNPLGQSSQFKYAWCIKSNFDVVTNGQGSTVQP